MYLSEEASYWIIGVTIFVYFSLSLVHLYFVNRWISKNEDQRSNIERVLLWISSVFLIVALLMPIWLTKLKWFPMTSSSKKAKYK
ncbi:hypothetical protein SHELI_v1c01830 [Spiroplasma helicoides]|uniref:Uncharacterized protein n=1 Tax=Spiroplasma helicoides TaxID=216938 RepID=A0A1B3SJN7_9MOLU|nr:hypothetical protein [Spiroplasma helicoides]AOG60138.1 hypothetical protein SHELI_v1c01830 [Spiroplasma helicoides]